MLEALERGNLFVVPLDDRRQWYRYHHLFADVLRAHLLDEQPDRVPDLHRRASAWYEQNGEPSEAIRHALAAGDFERAADLVELAVPGAAPEPAGGHAARLARGAPRRAAPRRPVLSVAYAGALLASGELEGVEARLRDAERWLDAGRERRAPTARRPAWSSWTRRSSAVCPATIAMYRAGTGPGPRRCGRHGRPRPAGARPRRRGRPSAARGGRGAPGARAWASGDLEAAHRSYADGMASLQRAGHLSDALGGAIALADIRIAQGRLREAMSAPTSRRCSLRPSRARRSLRGAADMHVGLSELHRERNDLDAAPAAPADAARSWASTPGLPQNPYRWRVAMARIREAEGDLDGALDLLDEAERLYVGDFFPDVRPIAALTGAGVGRAGQARPRRSAGRASGACRVEDDLELPARVRAHHAGPGAPGPATRDRARPPLREAIGLLERLLPAAEDGGRTGSVIEILVLQALAHQARGDLPRGARAAGARPGAGRAGGLRPRLRGRRAAHGGPAGAAAKRGIAPAYVRRLLAAFGTAEARRPPSRTLVEPLSERELDVLRLLATDLDGPDIARELVVSLNTMRTHTKNIYAKLGVNNRRAAVRRADELDLLSRGAAAPLTARRSHGPPRRSPRRSPHVVMRAHHVRS